MVLSIHDLTRRSTVKEYVNKQWTGLSIHDLTRRSTSLKTEPCNLQIFFQFTTSQGGRPSFQIATGQPTIFQFTTSQGGRHVTLFNSSIYTTLSIHDLTRRSTIQRHGETPLPDTFQFTTSQGGRRKTSGFCVKT